MKLKMIVVLSVAVAAGFIIGGAACSHSSKEPAPVSGQKIAYYTCAMHPSVKSDTPGSCHICGMELIPVYTNAPAAKS
jgi:Cu(I)/Ag(I) efflux system membrane fusion protein